jgi:hypothetical protein
MPDKKVFAISEDLDYTCFKNQLRLADLKTDRWPGKKDAMSDSAIRYGTGAFRADPPAISLACDSRGLYGDFRTKPDEIRTRIHKMLDISNLQLTSLFAVVRTIRKTSTFLVQRGGGGVQFPARSTQKYNKRDTKYYKKVGGGAPQSAWFGKI